MPPSSQRKTRARKQPDLQDRSEIDDADLVATPTRKRRRVNNADATKSPTTDPAYDTRLESSARRRKTRSSNVKIFEEEDASFNEDDSESVIRNLRKAKYDIRAKVDYANEVQEVAHPDGKQAYAKIAGNGWTFYVDDLEVRIGRPPDERLPAQDSAHGNAPVNGIDDKSHVHIDLGPSKIISRLHAEIRYNANEDKWYIAVNGRNGLKLDEQPLQRGQTSVLHCGSVIDVAGTQMMFVTPNDEPVIHPAISLQARKQEDEDDDDDDDDGLDGQRPSHAQRTPIRGPAPRSSSGRHPSSTQLHSPSHQQGHRGYIRTAATASLMQTDGTSDGPSRSGQPAPKTSPTYSRGVIIESSEDIDYSLETAKDLKPPHSYAQLIGMAILDSPEEKLTLAKIYDWIKLHYAFYRFSGGGWQNSIRHNLSLNKCFEKIARRTDEPGKGMKWQIVAEHRDEFIKKGLSNVRRTGGRGSSGPESPAKDGYSRIIADRRGDDPFYTSSNQEASRRSSHYVKNSPGSTPPKPSGYHQSGPGSTPDRGGMPHLHGAEGSSPRFTTGTSPFPFNRNRFNGLNETAAAGSPGGPTMLLGSDPNDHFATPLVTRHAPRLAPPSTAHLPSQFMQMSSPAPFWKYADFGSTPARPNIDVSPVKTAKKERPITPTEAGSGPHVEGAHVKLSGIQSSSPPVASREAVQESPTRHPSSRGGDRVVGSVDTQGTPPVTMPVDATMNGPAQAPEPGPVSGPQAGDDEEEEEEGLIDLARGFQPIGSFHRNMSASVISGN